MPIEQHGHCHCNCNCDCHVDSSTRLFMTPQPNTTQRRSLSSNEYHHHHHYHSEGGNKKGSSSSSSHFHVIHKVPPGDSPYVKAKRVQLIEKEPSKAISLFWAAINACDRVDSALKDMAAVMKQLNRSDEAIEAIKSFRHLCPYHSQESIDNVLVELYKRSGRIHEEIDLLERKLITIEASAAGATRTKNARSQGKKIQITMEQERSRILGNLAWAYLQLEKYEIAEKHYRKALLLDPDKNKQCNLAICLMKMKRFTEAKSLLQSVKSATGNRKMDESYAKSYERAIEMLNEHQMAKDEDNCDTMQRPFLTPFNKNLRQVSSLMYGGGGQDYALYTQPRYLRSSTQVKDKQCFWFDQERAAKHADRVSSWRHGGFAQAREAAELKADDEYRNWESESWRSGNQKVSEMRESWRKPINAVADCLTETTPMKPQKKSWADMVEEEEALNDENVKCYVDAWPLSQCKVQDEEEAENGSSGNRSVRRSLFFEQQPGGENETSCYSSSGSGNIKRRNRLQVFRDITPFPDSP